MLVAGCGTVDVLWEIEAYGWCDGGERKEERICWTGFSVGVFVFVGGSFQRVGMTLGGVKRRQREGASAWVDTTGVGRTGWVGIWVGRQGAGKIPARQSEWERLTSDVYFSDKSFPKQRKPDVKGRKDMSPDAL
jgi:hypothetical protein